MKIFLLHTLLVIVFFSFVQHAYGNPLSKQNIQFEQIENDTIRFGHYNIILSNQDTIKGKKRNKLIAIAADLLTGPLGGHRIYLGTEPYVPIIYALTLGGGMGFLPVTDLFVIIFTRKLEIYCDNPQIIMWL